MKKVPKLNLNLSRDATGPAAPTSGEKSDRSTFMERIEEKFNEEMEPDEIIKRQIKRKRPNLPLF